MTDETNSNENLNKDSKKNFWNEDLTKALETFGQITIFIVVPVLLAVLIGKSLDNHYNTYPLIFLLSSAFGFLISIFGIIKTVKRYIKD